MAEETSVSQGRPLVRFEGITKRFGKHAAVADLSLDINRNEFFALLGPSGCGKTTLLRPPAGPRGPRRRPHPARRTRYGGAAAAPAAGQHDVPELRVVSASHRRRQCRIR